jgi:hypothetical protein
MCVCVLIRKLRQLSHDSKLRMLQRFASVCFCKEENCNNCAVRVSCRGSTAECCVCVCVFVSKLPPCGRARVMEVFFGLNRDCVCVCNHVCYHNILMTVIYYIYIYIYIYYIYIYMYMVYRMHFQRVLGFQVAFSHAVRGKDLARHMTGAAFCITCHDEARSI